MDKIHNYNWHGLFQNWHKDGSRYWIDQNKEGLNGPKIRFRYDKTGN